MKLGVISGTRYHRVGNQYYTNSSYHLDIWEECLEIFDELILADRVICADYIEEGEKPVLADRISFVDFPDFQGFVALLMTLPRIFLESRKAARRVDVWLLHGPNFVSICMWFWLWFYKVPYCMELRGEQGMNYTYLKLRGVRFPGVVSVIMRFLHKLQLSRPVGVVGVSKSLLRDFPPGNDCPTFAISDSRIPSEMYCKERTWKDGLACRTIICVGRCAVSKNPLGTMRALAKLNQRGFTNWKMVWLGSGPLEEETRRLILELGISPKVNLLGFIPWTDVFGFLDSADLFLLNSVCEGMPRAMLEAMARGLPAIATDVGGVPELLAPEDVVPILQDDTLADKLYEVLRDPDRLTAMSRRNLETAKNYSAEVLRTRKVEFYKDLRIITEKYLKRKERDNTTVL
jgi:glycosyltransferase involved in cell wall biosynthesis